MPDKRRRLITDLVVGAVITAAVLALGLSRGYTVLRSLCDGLFVAAVLELGVGGIVAARNKGTFDTAGFGIKYTLGLVIPALRSPEKEDVVAYAERKAKSRKPASALLISGEIYLVLSVLTLVVYFTVE